MPTLDWIFAAVLLFSMVLGGWRGLVYEVLSLVNWVVAFVLARWLALTVAGFLPMSGASETMRYAAGFLLVFIAATMVGGLIITLIKKLTKSVGLRAIDRVLGVAFGLTRGVLWLLVVTWVVSLTPLRDNKVWKESAGVRIATGMVSSLRSVLPQDVGRYLPA